MTETLALVKKAGFPGVLIIGEPEYYPKVGFIRCKDCGITDAEGNSWDAYMVYEFEKGNMHIPGVMEEPYDITDGIPPVPPADYESQFETWTRAAVPCQFMYPNPSDENNGYHLRQGEVCGAVSGALMVLGLLYSKYEKVEPMSRESTNVVNDLFLKRFKEECGSYICNDLLGADLRTPEGMAYIKEHHLFGEFCPKMVAKAVDILEEILVRQSV